MKLFKPVVPNLGVAKQNNFTLDFFLKYSLVISDGKKLMYRSGKIKNEKYWLPIL